MHVEKQNNYILRSLATSVKLISSPSWFNKVTSGIFHQSNPASGFAVFVGAVLTFLVGGCSVTASGSLAGLAATLAERRNSGIDNYMVLKQMKYDVKERKKKRRSIKLQTLE